jgi:hypothetical protein
MLHLTRAASPSCSLFCSQWHLLGYRSDCTSLNPKVQEWNPKAPHAWRLCGLVSLSLLTQGWQPWPATTPVATQPGASTLCLTFLLPLTGVCSQHRLHPTTFTLGLWSVSSLGGHPSFFGMVASLIMTCRRKGWVMWHTQCMCICVCCPGTPFKKWCFSSLSVVPTDGFYSDLFL